MNNRAQNITTCWIRHVTPQTLAGSNPVNISFNKYTYEVNFTPPESISGKRCRLVAGPFYQHYDSGNKSCRISMSGIQFPYNNLTIDCNYQSGLNPNTLITNATLIGYNTNDITVDTNMSQIIYLARTNDITQFGPPIIANVPDGPTRLTFTVEWPRQAATNCIIAAPISYEIDICLSFEPME